MMWLHGLLLVLLSGGCAQEYKPPGKGDWQNDRPGVSHRVEIGELPPPYVTKSANTGYAIAPRPEGVLPQVPKGFKVELFAHEKMGTPQMIRTAPNGDLLISDAKHNTIWILRDSDQDGKAEVIEPFATGLEQLFGIAFYPPQGEPEYVYIATAGAVIRFPCKNGDLKVQGKGEKLIDLPSATTLTGGGHWTRDIAFSPDGKRIYISIGSLTDHEDVPEENARARILEYTPDGKAGKVYAWGLRNPVSLAFHPETKALWITVNERDELGDDLVPDYVTEVKEGGFYGFPWYYLGGIQDPRVKKPGPRLRSKRSFPMCSCRPTLPPSASFFPIKINFPHPSVTGPLLLCMALGTVPRAQAIRLSSSLCITVKRTATISIS